MTNFECKPALTHKATDLTGGPDRRSSVSCVHLLGFGVDTPDTRPYGPYFAFTFILHLIDRINSTRNAEANSLDCHPLQKYARYGNWPLSSLPNTLSNAD